MTGPYDDIINLPHPTSAKHPRMPLSDRAAQFAPFAALSGHSAALVETARLTDQRMELARMPGLPWTQNSNCCWSGSKSGRKSR